jgi:hypothetical protein
VLNIANVVVELNVEPIFHDLLVQGLELVGGLFLTIQVLLSHVNLIHDPIVPLHHLQSAYLLHPIVGVNTVGTDVFLDLIKALLESPHPTHSNKVLGCLTSMLVVNSGVLSKDMAIADSVNLWADFAILVLVFMEPEGESALGIFSLHLFSRKGNTLGADPYLPCEQIERFLRLIFKITHQLPRG